MTRARVVVVGLGPAGGDLVLPAARHALELARVRFVRTARHPAVADLEAAGIAMEPLDHHYDAAASLDDAYRAIVEELAVAARREGEVAYAVPGSPVVAERTVDLLREAGLDVELVPGLSFTDLAWARVGVDPMGGARIVDGRSLQRPDLLWGGPLLVAQCDNASVLSDVKLLLLEALPGDAEAVVLQRLGTTDEAVTRVTIPELDRVVEPDHLTSVFVDLGEGSAHELARFQALVERLRGPGGCPWDAEQTHHSLTRHLVEEAYEVVEAIEQLPADAPGGASPVPEGSYALLEEELGDLAAQVVFHATLARETGAFTLADVLRGIREKLVRRHPHVFGDVEVESADAVMRNWEQIKRDERRAKGAEHAEEEAQAPSRIDDVPRHLPSLLYAHKLLRTAASAGLEPMTVGEAARVAGEALGRLPDAPDDTVERLMGEVLAALVLVARRRGIDAESALRGWAHRFRERFGALERLAAERGVDLSDADPGEVAGLWIEAGTAPA